MRRILQTMRAALMYYELTLPDTPVNPHHSLTHCSHDHSGNGNRRDKRWTTGRVLPHDWADGVVLGIESCDRVELKSQNGMSRPPNQPGRRGTKQISTVCKLVLTILVKMVMAPVLLRLGYRSPCLQLLEKTFFIFHNWAPE